MSATPYAELLKRLGRKKSDDGFYINRDGGLRINWINPDGPEAAEVISSLLNALAPFAEVAAWAERNGHDLHNFDMLLRHINGAKAGHFAGHLQVQADDFLNARAALNSDASTQVGGDR
jgi:hypothetical protein